MNNPLTAPVQIVSLHEVVWYTPQGFPDVETCADLLARDGDFLMIWNGWEYKIICTLEVERTVSARSVGHNEAIAVEWEEYDADQAKS